MLFLLGFNALGMFLPSVKVWSEYKKKKKHCTGGKREKEMEKRWKQRSEKVLSARRGKFDATEHCVYPFMTTISSNIQIHTRRRLSLYLSRIRRPFICADFGGCSAASIPRLMLMLTLRMYPSYLGDSAPNPSWMGCCTTAWRVAFLLWRSIVNYHVYTGRPQSRPYIEKYKIIFCCILTTKTENSMNKKKLEALRVSFLKTQNVADI